MAKTYTNDKVEVRQVGINIRQAIVKDKDVKHAVQVQEQQPVRETIVQTQKDDNRLSNHDPQRHGRDEAHLLDDINLLFGNGKLLGVFRVVLPNRLGNHDPGQRLRQEAHADSKRDADDDVDPKDPGQAHIGIIGDPFAHGTSNRRTGVGGGDKQGHGLACAIRVAE